MTFTDKDKAYLLEKVYGGDKEAFDGDLPQIEEAADCTTYQVLMNNQDKKGPPITRTGAIRMLGREMWLNGLVRSAFHWTACRYLDDGRHVFFDSSALFRD